MLIKTKDENGQPMLVNLDNFHFLSLQVQGKQRIVRVSWGTGGTGLLLTEPLDAEVAEQVIGVIAAMIGDGQLNLLDLKDFPQNVPSRYVYWGGS